MKRTLSRRRRQRRGFTLMEILLVLAILVILGSLVGIGYFQIQKGMTVDATKTEIKTLEQAVEMYQLGMGRLPTMDEGLEALIVPPAEDVSGRWKGPYLKATQVPYDPWESPYNYEVLDADEFQISSNGPDGQQGTDDDVFIIR